MNQAFKEGLEDGINGRYDQTRELNHDYLDGVAEGMYRYHSFITSTADHTGIKNPDDFRQEVPLITADRLESPFLKKASFQLR
jgi:hypothetical protein